MSRLKTLELSPSGGLFCPLDGPYLHSNTGDKNACFIDCNDTAKPNSYRFIELFKNFLSEEDEESLTQRSFVTDGDIFLWGLDQVRHSALGRSFLSEAKLSDWSVLFEDRSDFSLHLDFEHRVLSLPRLTPSNKIWVETDELLCQFLHHFMAGLRQIWISGLGLPLCHHLTLNDYILFARLQKMDQDLAVLVMGWELRQQGHHDFWRYLLSTSLTNLASHLQDQLSGSILDDMLWDTTEAEDLAYHAQDDLMDCLSNLSFLWFEEDDLITDCDFEALQAFDAFLGRVKTTRTLNEQDIMRLGLYPDSQSYTDMTAIEFLQDPFYRRQTDIINQQHKWQIEQDSDWDDYPREPDEFRHEAHDLFRDQNLAQKIFPQSTFTLLT
jgi:hypothetical protein